MWTILFNPPSLPLLTVCAISLLSLDARAKPLPLVHREGDLGLSSSRRDRNTSYVLTTSTFNTSSFQAQPFVTNGYIGARIPVEGIGFKRFEPNNATAHDGTNGWPIFDDRLTATMVAGFYDQQDSTEGTNFEIPGGQQVVSLLPTWNSLFATFNPAGLDGSESTYGVGVDHSTVSNFTQSLSLRDGVVKTSLIYTPPSSTQGGDGTSSRGYRLDYTVLAHRSRPTLGLVKLQVSGLEPGEKVVISDVLDGAGARRVEAEQAGRTDGSELSNSIWSSVRPLGISNVTAWEFSTTSIEGSSSSSSPGTDEPLPSTVGGLISTNSSSTSTRSYAVSASSEGRVTVYKYVGVASSDAFGKGARSKALSTAKSASEAGWNSLVSEHRGAWEEIWSQGGEIEIHDDSDLGKELQRTTRASLFYLLANSREGNEGSGLGDNSIAPAGLTSDSYAEGIFWDAETWMYPSLLSLYPSFAESINNYRSKNLGAAMENARKYNRSGLLYPWVAFRFGNETGIGPAFDYEYHLNNDIALAQWQYYQATGNKTWLEEKGYPIMKAVSEFWASQVILDAKGNYTTLNETDPDEYANFKNNAAFTNAGISVVLKDTIQAATILGRRESDVANNWTEIVDKISILTNGEEEDTVVLEYDGFNGSTPVKQADVVLLNYPLEYPVPDAGADQSFYAGATSPDGPGMTYSVFSINSAQLSTRGCESFTYLLQASEPYVREPFAQFSEQTSDTYSTNGGTNPAYTFLTGHGGFLQTWTHGLTGYRSRTERFYLDPSLPPQLAPKGFSVKGMFWRGNRLDVKVEGEQTTISHVKGERSVQVEIGSRNPEAGNYTLRPGQKLKVPTYRSDLAVEEVENLVQCKTVSSNSSWVAGQYPLAALDGSNATYWQPDDPDSTHHLLIDLGEETHRSLQAVHINWSQNPARKISIQAGNSTRNLDQTILQETPVTISEPYQPSQADQVKVKVGNLTDLQFQPPSLPVRFVRFSIQGSFSDQGEGATVAELVLV
ncbi:hypothetical protein IE53DRAFT_391103 [Violaceomyces palustris]|uniref:Uncharacterized protein n=1 Tax=Violaceomyces palustris TaxID=1673888 RepID=A0ACD0NLP8_9BASI|nr:hypothetical protein IE53DRAFT_391103 [Violaceomyces palustris]